MEGSKGVTDEVADGDIVTVLSYNFIGSEAVNVPFFSSFVSVLVLILRY